MLDLGFYLMVQAGYQVEVQRSKIWFVSTGQWIGAQIKSGNAFAWRCSKEFCEHVS